MKVANIEMFSREIPFFDGERKGNDTLANIIKSWNSKIPKKGKSKEQDYDIYLREDENYQKVLSCIHFFGNFLSNLN